MIQNRAKSWHASYVPATGGACLQIRVELGVLQIELAGSARWVTATWVCDLS